MGSKTELHLFTGAKGGVGKTLLCLLASLYSLVKRERVLIVDLNLFNNDIYEILSRLAKQRDRFNLQEELDRDPIPDEDEFGENGFLALKIDGGLLVTIDSRHSLQYRLPLGIAGFYDEYLNKVFSLKKVQAFMPDICLVDTGFHLASLALAETDACEDSWLGKGHSSTEQVITNHLKDMALKIWFLWNHTSWERKPELHALEQACYQIANLGVGTFSHKTSLLHAYNPYMLYAEPDVFEYIESLFGARHPLRKMVNDDRFGDSVTLDFMGREIGNKIRDTQQTGHLDKESYPKIIGETILRRHGGKRPRNFFPFLTYPHLKNYFAEVTSDSGPKDLTSLKSFLGDPFITMENYLINWRRSL